MDTIAAIATPVGQSAIGIIKLSGPDALKITQKIYRGKRNKKLTTVPSHSIHYGHIIDPVVSHKIDEVLISVMRAPHSYTREDVIEINCHGGRIALYKVLELVLQEGARLAEPGEFTKRAFINGRIDLTQAEAVIDLINVQSERGLSFLLNTLDGNTYQALHSLHDEVIAREAQIEAELNFSTEGSFDFSKKELLQDIERWSKTIDAYICSYKTCNILVNGLNMVIAGSPNVGKSSLMNLLVQKERCIVTPIPGTTTDVVEDSFYLNGILIRLSDTAGFSQPKNTIEQEGIRRSHDHITQADLIMVVLDGSRPLVDGDRQVIELVCRQDRLFFVVLNKMDLGVKLRKDFLIRFTEKEIPVLRVSALTRAGISEIPNTIAALCLPDDHDNLNLGINLRQKRLLLHIQKSFKVLDDLLRTGQSEDLLAEEFRVVNEQFKQFRGRSVSEDLLDQIFSRFCVGK